MRFYLVISQINGLEKFPLKSMFLFFFFFLEKIVYTLEINKHAIAGV